MRCVISAAILVWTAASCYAAVDYARDVQPIFASRCFACHGPQRALGGLRLDDADRAASATHKLLARATSTDPKFRMPLGGPPLSADQIATLKASSPQAQTSRP